MAGGRDLGACRPHRAQQGAWCHAYCRGRPCPHCALRLSARRYSANEDANVHNWIAISIGLALLLGVTAQGQTTKDSYPSRPVRIIVPFAAGGPGDIFARLIGQKLSEQLGQQFFIENRPGASGNIGTAVAARAPADGYTLMVGSSAVWINASLYPQLPYDPVRDFEPIIIGATLPEVLVVHP